MPTYTDPSALLELLSEFSEPVPSFLGSDESIKAMRFAALAGNVDETRQHLITVVRAMIKAIAPKVKPDTFTLTICPGLPAKGNLSRFTFASYKSHGYTKTGKSFTGEGKIASEILDDPQALGLALAYLAVLHVGAATGVRTASNRARYINEAGSTLFGELGLKRRADSIKSSKGRIDGLYGYVPIVTSEFLASFGLDQKIKVHGARPGGMTWGQLVKAYKTLGKVVAAPSDTVKLACKCCDRKDADGKTIPVEHRAHGADVLNGYFRTSCFVCGSAWRADVDEKGKLTPVLVHLMDAIQAMQSARKSDAA